VHGVDLQTARLEADDQLNTSNKLLSEFVCKFFFNKFGDEIEAGNWFVVSPF
jgi:hypothetical protein